MEPEYISYEQWLKELKRGAIGKQSGYDSMNYIWDENQKKIKRYIDDISPKSMDSTTLKHRKSHDFYDYWILEKGRAITLEEVMNEWD